ncbi:hypothetical protein A3Q56_03138 [Intoshia linei]|uniref:Uncharacterized protein n=1 Tax=Intoshia linei TaxID=1819745 RepID=A0A177B629_9BILA|nr:hypothetical protein A3Q56_03138 [Intoshia linei]
MIKFFKIQKKSHRKKDLQDEIKHQLQDVDEDALHINENCVEIEDLNNKIEIKNTIFNPTNNKVEFTRSVSSVSDETEWSIITENSCVNADTKISKNFENLKIDLNDVENTEITIEDTSDSSEKTIWNTKRPIPLRSTPINMDEIDPNIHHRINKRYKTNKDALKQFRSPIVRVIENEPNEYNFINMMIGNEFVKTKIIREFGATLISSEFIKKNTYMVNNKDEIKIPAILLLNISYLEDKINFKNYHKIFDVIIFVLKYGEKFSLEMQKNMTICKKYNIKCIIVVDSIHEWQSYPNMDIFKTFQCQPVSIQFKLEKFVLLINEDLRSYNMDGELFGRNNGPIPIIPVSTTHGDGMGNVLLQLSIMCQNQMKDKMTYVEGLEAITLGIEEVKGRTAINAIVINGEICQNDTIVVSTESGQIHTKVDSIVTEEYVHYTNEMIQIEHKEISTTCLIKIMTSINENTICSSQIYVALFQDEIEYFKSIAGNNFKLITNWSKNFHFYKVIACVRNYEELIYLKNYISCLKKNANYICFWIGAITKEQLIENFYSNIKTKNDISTLGIIFGTSFITLQIDIKTLNSMNLNKMDACHLSSYSQLRKKITSFLMNKKM